MKTHRFTQFTIVLLGLTAATLPALAGGPVAYPKNPVPLADHAPPPDLWDAHRPDSHAPIGIMGDHTHEAGEWMVSYRYMDMDMDENYAGSNSVSDASVISPTGGGYLVTPTEMTTEMHMAGVMHAPTDYLTLSIMVPYVSKSMDHLRRDGLTFTTKSRDWGDLKIGTLWKVYDAQRQRVHLNLGVSAPTGATNEADYVPGPGQTRLPYPMQIGSGTWDLLLGATYLGQTDHFSWGAQGLGTVRLGTNNEGYSLGNRIDGHLWGAWNACRWISFSSRFSIRSWGNIDGQDNNLVIPATVVPTADPSLRGGTRVDWAGGVNFYVREGALNGARFAFEMGLPLWQDLNGPQLGNNYFLTAGFQMAF